MRPIAYRFDPETFEFLSEEREIQKDPLESEIEGKDVWLCPGNCTFTRPPTIEIFENFKFVWNESRSIWIKTEDHRRKYNIDGTIKENSGTPFWLPGDMWKDSPRYVTELGPLPKDAILDPPQKSYEEKYAERISYIANIRNSKLSESDYIVLEDYKKNLSKEEYEAWIEYRKELRDITLKDGYPWMEKKDEEIPWPKSPKENKK